METLPVTTKNTVCIKRIGNILIVKHSVNGIVMRTHEILQAKTVFFVIIFNSYEKLESKLIPKRYIVTN